MTSRARTRIAIVGASEALRAALARALGESDAFEIAGVGEEPAGISPPADVILIVRDASAAAALVRSVRGDTIGGALLSTREREVLALLADGLGNKQIAARLGISRNTVKTHLELLFEKLGVSSRAEAVATAVKRGLLYL